MSAEQRQEVVRRYAENRVSLAAIAREFGVTPMAIKYHASRARVAPRAKGIKLVKLSLVQRTEVVTRYVAGESSTQLARELGVNRGAILEYVHRAGIPIHPPKGRSMTAATCSQCRREFTYNTHRKRCVKKFCSHECMKLYFRANDHPACDATPVLDRKGYRRVRVPDGHVSQGAGLNRRYRHKYLEHIIIAEGVLGRPLKKGELVHHINGDKADNRSSNLLICTNRYHVELHARMSLFYQREKFGSATMAAQDAA